MATDADIVAGDSGGPLVNTAGAVIGMDTAGSSSYQLRGSSSQGFAIPIATALSIARAIETGTSTSTVHVGTTAFLGIGVRATSGVSGAVIAQLVTDGPAASAGLVAGDLITRVAGTTITSPDALTTALLSERPGDRVRVVYTDQAGTTHSVTVTLGSGPAQ